MREYCKILETDEGWIGYRGSERGIRKLFLPLTSREKLLSRYGLSDENASGLRVLDNLLTEYFIGDEADFSKIRLDLSEVPEFHKRVYDETREIPYGETKTYGEIARSIGSPNAARAVGNALRLNPLPIIVPCHRVLGSNNLGGFTPSLEMKKRLLRLE